MSSPPIITLTTDFGTTDAYVGAMKGVILGINPSARIVDITHDIAPQDIAEAAFVLASCVPYFPDDSVHVAIVDPGVGSSRLPLAIRTGTTVYIGPDNGIFGALLAARGAVDLATGVLVGASAVNLAEPRYRLDKVSTTFHGRDVFAPAAAHISLGVPVENFGPSVSHLVMLPESVPNRTDDGLTGTVVYVDRFGNAVTNIALRDLPPHPVFSIGATEIRELSSTYAERDISALVGSTGHVEIAVRNGSAADVLGISVGDRLMVRTYR